MIPTQPGDSCGRQQGSKTSARSESRHFANLLIPAPNWKSRSPRTKCKNHKMFSYIQKGKMYGGSSLGLSPRYIACGRSLFLCASAPAAREPTGLAPEAKSADEWLPIDEVAGRSSRSGSHNSVSKTKGLSPSESSLRPRFCPSIAPDSPLGA